MGLLDEAIREHLELKRRSGADPSAVAHEEREALSPVLDDDVLEEPPSGAREGQGAAPEGAQPFDAQAGEQPPPAAAEARPASAPMPGVPGVPAGEDRDAAFAHAALGEETAELDMLSVMGEDPAHAAVSGIAGDAGAQDEGLEPALHAGDEPALGSFDDDVPDEDVFETDVERSPAREAPGQERLSFE
ncbi:MAG TPA: hypothetical protein VKV16_09655 [Solirubrobacteraceae bacterium]|nr:hypothetical protein [Solirubrobacteraceae bacterium]